MPRTAPRAIPPSPRKKSATRKRLNRLKRVARTGRRGPLRGKAPSDWLRRMDAPEMGALENRGLAARVRGFCGRLRKGAASKTALFVCPRSSLNHLRDGRFVDNFRITFHNFQNRPELFRRLFVIGTSMPATARQHRAGNIF
jgi:hypothetical protein